MDVRNIEVGDTNIVDNTIHIRYDGTSHDYPINELGIDTTTPDNMVKQAMVNWLDLDNEDALDKYVIEHHDNGDITVRPEAVFG